MPNIATNNNELVELARNCPRYSEHDFAQAEHIFEAMRQVDRQQFIPANMYTPIASVDPEVFANILRLTVQGFMPAAMQKRTIGLETEPGYKLKMDAETQEFFDETYLTMAEAIGLLTLFANRIARSTNSYHVPTRELAYTDQDLGLGYQRTCLRPSLAGFMLYLLELQPGMRVLELGTNCGYQTAIASYLVGKEGHVVTVEPNPNMAEDAQRNLKAHFASELEERIDIVVSNNLSTLQAQPFDRVYYTASPEYRDLRTLGPIPMKLISDNAIVLTISVGDLVCTKLNHGERTETVYKKAAYTPVI